MVGTPKMITLLCLYLCFDGWKLGSNSVNFVVISAGIMCQFYVLSGFCCKITCGQPDENNGFVLFNKVWFQCFPYKACIIYTAFWFRDNQKVNILLGGYLLLKGKTFAVSYQNGLLFLSFPSSITKANVKYTIRDFNLRHKVWCSFIFWWLIQKVGVYRSFSKSREKMADPGQDPNT